MRRVAAVLALALLALGAPAFSLPAQAASLLPLLALLIGGVAFYRRTRDGSNP